MAEPFLGEIRIVGFNFAPEGWAFCNGQLMPISQAEALFNLIGTTYGGDGVTTFGLPDLRGRTPIGQGTGQGMTPRTMGQTAGEESVKLDATTTPPHNHPFLASKAAASNVDPKNNVLAVVGTATLPFYSDGVASGTLAANTVSVAGSSTAHENRQPLQAQNYIICLNGEYPRFD